MPEEISFDVLEKAIAALEAGLREHAQYPHLTTVRDGVIQRFEVAVDLSRKMTLRVLHEIYGIQGAEAQKNTVREAARVGLLDDAAIPAFVPDARSLLGKLKDAAAA